MDLSSYEREALYFLLNISIFFSLYSASLGSIRSRVSYTLFVILMTLLLKRKRYIQRTTTKTMTVVAGDRTAIDLFDNFE